MVHVSPKISWAEKFRRAKTLLQSRRARRLAAWGLGLILAFGVFGFLVAPPLAKSLLVDQLSRQLHRQVSVAQVDINPYALSASLAGVSVKDEGGREVLGFDRLYVNLSLASIAHRGVVIDEVRLEQPRLRVARLAEGRYDISDLLDEWLKPSEGATPRFSLNNIQISGGLVEFADRPVDKTHTLSDIEIRVPFVSSLPYQAEIQVEPLFAAHFDGSDIKLTGRSTPFAASHHSELDLDLDHFDLTRLQPYVPATVPFAIQGGAVDSELKLVFAEAADKPQTLGLTGQLHVHDLALADRAGGPLVGWKRLDIGLEEIDLLHRHFVLDQVTVDGLHTHLAVNRQGSLNWLAVVDQLTRAPAGAKPAAQAEPAEPLEWAVKEVSLKNGTVSWRDESTGTPVQGRIQDIEATVHHLDGKFAKPVRLDLAWGVDFGEALKVGRIAVKNAEVEVKARRVNVAEIDGKEARVSLARTKAGAIDWLPIPQLKLPAAPAGGKGSAPWTVNVGKFALTEANLRFADQSTMDPAVVTLSNLAIKADHLSTERGQKTGLDIAGKINDKGDLKVAGSVQVQPLTADLDVSATGFPLLPLQPYFGEYLNITLTKGQVSTQGKLAVQAAKDGLAGGFKGELTLGDLNSVDKANSTDFLRWKSLYLGGIDLRLQPFGLTVGEVALSDFYSRLIVTPEGKLNLAQIVRQPEGDKAAAGKPAAVPTPPPAAGEAKVASVPAKVLPPVRIDKVTLQNGTVNFSDRFVKPNYTANLTKLGGRISGLSSAPGSVANMELRGNYANTAPVQILAKLNPLAAKPYLDLQGEVRGIDLEPFSPYSGKYAGYAIEKGKLSVTVNYKLENNQLTADNRIFLDQLTFGDKVDSPDATKLPVNLAVSLLKNGRGEIDINLPISGSLDDPQFSVGGVIVRVIVNLFVKAVTSPFALLGSLFGGGEELSILEFDPGRVAFGATSVKRLEALAKALNDRPALRLEIRGRVDPETDREGLRRVAMERAVRAEKQKDLVKKGVDSGSTDSIEVDAKEYPAYLQRAYKAAKFPKPRNLIGFTKDLPVEEMEKLMLTNLPASDDDLELLADQRAEAVQLWLVEQGKVPAERVFIAPSKVGPDKGGADKAKASRVDFALK